MSASKQKKTRIEQRSEGPSKKAAAAAEQAKKDQAFRVKAIIAFAVIVVIVAAALLINSNIFYTRTAAVQVGNTKYSPAEVNYFYKNTFNSIYQYYYEQLGSNVSMVLDPSKPLSDQPYSGDQTWADYIFESAQQEMKRVTVYYDAAVKAGYTLTAEDQVSVDSSLAQMQSLAETNNFPNLNKLLVAYYGKGMNESTFTKLCQKVAIAGRYSNDLLEGLTYSDEELEAYYQEHADKMDVYNYYLYNVTTSNASFDDLEDDDAKKQAAHDAAEKIAAAANADDFVAAVKEFAGEDYNFNRSGAPADSLGSSYKSWMTDSARKPGDTTVVESDLGYYAIMYLGFEDNNYNLVDMRHILVNVETDDDGHYTEEAKAAALEKLEGIRSEWETLGGDETSFATLANQYSDDGGSNTGGGLYTDIVKGRMVAPVEDFLFAPGRKVGDTDIVFNDGSYVGYHLLYLVGEGENHRVQLAKDAKTTEDFNAMYETMSSGYEVQINKAIKYANLT